MVSNSAPKKRVASTVTLRDVSPEYAALWDKKQELCKRREEVQREVLALREPLSRAGEFSSLAIACNTAPNALGAPQVSKPSPEVALLLGDLMPPPAAPLTSPIAAAISFSIKNRLT